MRRLIASILVVVISAACGRGAPQPATTGRRLVFLTRDGCALSAKMRESLDLALRAMNRTDGYDVIDQGTLARSDARIGYGTPTLLYDGRDVFGLPEPRPPFPEPT
jgi:hypothetical protein